jgi:ABC-type histidine transport system ATPase subunit
VDECNQHERCSDKLIKNCLDVSAIKESVRALEYEYKQLNPFIERVMVERERLVETQFSLVRQKFDAQAEALIHAEKVMESRLHALNALREQVEANTRIYLREDVYREKTKFYDAWIDTVNRDITVMKTRSIIYTGVVGMVIILLDIVLRYAVK